jgi:hypothetical protein
MSEHDHRETRVEVRSDQRYDEAVNALVAAVLLAAPPTIAEAARAGVSAAISSADAATNERTAALGAALEIVAAHLSSPAPPRGLLRRRANGIACAEMATLLTARETGRLDPGDLDRLSRHLDRCTDCRSLAARFASARRAFDAALPAPARRVAPIVAVAAPRLVAEPVAAAVGGEPGASSFIPAALRDDASGEADHGSSPERGRDWIASGMEPSDAEPRASRASSLDDPPVDAWLTAEVAGHGTRSDEAAADSVDWLVGDSPAVAPIEDASPTTPADWGLDASDEAGATAVLPVIDDRAQRHRGRSRARSARRALPALVGLAGVVIAMAAAGVFSGSQPPNQTDASAPAAAPPIGAVTSTPAKPAATPKRVHRATKKHARKHRTSRKSTTATSPTASTPASAAPPSSPSVQTPSPTQRAAPPVTPRKQAVSAPKPKSTPKPKTTTKPQPAAATTPPATGPAGSAPSSEPGRTP